MPADNILATLKTILTEEFDIQASAITSHARLAEDLDLDSIDAVDIILRMQEETGVNISPEDFKEVKTVGDVENVIIALKAKS